MKTAIYSMIDRTLTYWIEENTIKVIGLKTYEDAIEYLKSVNIKQKIEIM